MAEVASQSNHILAALASSCASQDVGALAFLLSSRCLWLIGDTASPRVLSYLNNFLPIFFAQGSNLVQDLPLPLALSGREVGSNVGADR